VPVGTHTPVKPRSPAVRDVDAAAADVALPVLGGAQAAAQHAVATSAANRPTDRDDVRKTRPSDNPNA
jgi:hypothetical protein